MGEGLKITLVILLFIVLYTLFGAVYSLLAGTNLSGEFSISIENAIMLAVSWPAFIFLLAQGGGSIGAFIASAIIFAIIVILFWISYLIYKVVFSRNHKKGSEDKYERLIEAHEKYLKKKNIEEGEEK